MSESLEYQPKPKKKKKPSQSRTTQKESRKQPQRNDSTPLMSRRNFLIGGAAALLAAGGATALFRGSEKGAAIREQVTEETTLEESLKFIQQEIESNKELESLYVYGDENTRHFINHTFNLFRKITNTPLTLEDFKGRSEIATLARMNEAQAHYDPSMIKDQRGIGGTVVLGEDDKKKVLFNKDSYVYFKDQLRAFNAQSPEFPDSVLELLLQVGLHEPFHLETEVDKLQTPFVYKVEDDTYTFDTNSGLLLNGVDEKTRQEVQAFNGFEETSIYLLQKQIFEPQIPFYKHFNTFPPHELVIMQELFTKGGYDTPEKILELRRSSTSTIDFINAYVPLVPNDTSIANTPEERSFIILSDISRQFEDHTPESIVRPKLDLLGNPSTSQVETAPITYTPKPAEKFIV